MANKVLPALLAGDTVVVKAPPTCPAPCPARWRPPWPKRSRPGVLNVVNGPGRRARAPHSSRIPGSTWSRSPAAGGHGPGGHGRGGRDHPPRRPGARWQRPRHPCTRRRGRPAAWRTASSRRPSSRSGQVCMAIKRLYVQRDRVDETVAALADRLAGEVVGDGLAEGVTMGPVHTASARDRVEAMVAEAARCRRHCVAARAGSAPRTRGVGGYFVSPALSWRRRPPRPDRARGAVRTCAAGDPLRRHRRRGARRRTTPSSGSAPRCGATTTRWPADVACTAVGGNGLRQHARHARHRHVRADGRVEAVGLRRRARTRGHAGVRPPARQVSRPGPAEQGANP